ncbi:MAG TPA: hypothetical protein VEA41_18925 [Salinarimonas sp.]|nr:hypothetical protein [Salinarimonas sp.]
MDEQGAEQKPEERIPLLVPDEESKPYHPPGHAEKVRATNAARGHLCKAIKANGQPCGWNHSKSSDYCYIHDPAITPEQRKANRSKRKFHRLGHRHKVKTIKDVLQLVSIRLDQWIQNTGGAISPEAEQTFCDLVRTYVQVYKCTSDEQALGIAHWNLKRRQA